jgi:hypothetical protein
VHLPVLEAGSEFVQLFGCEVIVAELHVGDCLQRLVDHLRDLAVLALSALVEVLQGRQVLVLLVIGKPSEKIVLLNHLYLKILIC